VRTTNTLDSICQFGVQLLPAADWKFAKLDLSPQDRLCRCKKYEMLFPNPSLLGRTRESYIMTQCYHNDIVGLSNRYLKCADNDYTPNRVLINEILDELCGKLKPHFSGPISLKEFLSTKTGALRKRYEDAAANVFKSGFKIEQMSTISAFIKNELYDEMKPPRMIMGRDPRFNLAYGLFTTPLEHAMTMLPQVSKGRNFKERGQQFFDLLYGKDYLEVDFSKYESTQRLGVLNDVELGIWSRLLTPSDFEIIRQLFIAKMRKAGHTLNNVKFEFWYCRGSGDMDTGLFNTLLTYVACRYFEKINGTGNGNFICDGDDNVMSVPIGAKYIDTFKLFGFDAKLEHRRDYHDVNYCSGKFLQYSPGKFYYVQDLHKLMQNLRTFRKIKFNHCKGAYFHSLGFMYKQLYPNFPVYSNISKFLMNMDPKSHVNVAILNEINPAHTEAFIKSNDLGLSVDPSILRVEIMCSFGFSPSEIDRLEDYYDNSIVVLRVDERRRYNATKQPAVKMSPVLIDALEQLMRNSIRKHIFSRPFIEKVVNNITY